MGVKELGCKGVNYVQQVKVGYGGGDFVNTLEHTNREECFPKQVLDASQSA